MKLDDYIYDLPPSRIAKYPLADRDASKLLVWEKGNITHKGFANLPSRLDDEWTMFFNNTKVLPARLFFRKSTGALIEVFLLRPIAPTSVISQAMEAKGSAVWQCTIGNLKKWKGEVLSSGLKGININAELIDRESKHVKLTWPEEDGTLAQVLHQIGNIPLPPYLNREAQPADIESYQTVYSKSKGAVAAPTAGLHFTDRVIADIKKREVKISELTLHVGAGTFLPVQQTDDVRGHEMHREQMVVTSDNLEYILAAKKIVAVGTTSMRTLESIYWYGVKLLDGDGEEFSVSQNAPYQERTAYPSRDEAITAVLRHANQHGGRLVGETSIFILPGYDFMVCDALVTNFHQPGSTLILLVAAFIGDGWRDMYDEALDHDYRFLSYGDSSLLFRSE